MPTGTALGAGVTVARMVNVPQEVSQQPSCVRILPREELACRFSVVAELALGFEHSNLHSRALRVDEVDEVDKGIINSLVGSDNRSCEQVKPNRIYIACLTTGMQVIVSRGRL